MNKLYKKNIYYVTGEILTQVHLSVKENIVLMGISDAGGAWAISLDDYEKDSFM